MSAPSTGSPRWSVLLRVGVGVFFFGLFVLLFSAGGLLGKLLTALGVALLLAGLLLAATQRPRRR